MCPNWKTTDKKTEEKMIGDRNRPLGLILEWKMMMMMMMMMITEIKKEKNYLLKTGLWNVHMPTYGTSYNI
jgi:hypothetical protein